MTHDMTDREKLQEYRSLADRCYGPEPTEYQRGVLQGIDCALSLLPDPNRPSPNNRQQYCRHEFTRSFSNRAGDPILTIGREICFKCGAPNPDV